MRDIPRRTPPSEATRDRGTRCRAPSGGSPGSPAVRCRFGHRDVPADELLRHLRLEDAYRKVRSIGRDDIDALSTRDVQLAATAVFARAGRPELAVDVAEQLLRGRYAPSAAHVWCSYEVAALRTDERFRTLISDRGMNVGLDPLQPHTWRRSMRR